MRSTGLLAAAGIAALCFFLSPHEAKAQWSDIDCSASKIAMPGMACRKGPSDTGGSGRCGFENYVTFGTKAGAYFNAFIYASTIRPDQCWVTQTAPTRFEQSIKANGWIKANGKDFAGVRDFQGGYAINFNSNSNRKCIAYYQPGPNQGGGLAYSQTGYFCGPVNRDFNDAQLADQLKNLTISK